MTANLEAQCSFGTSNTLMVIITHPDTFAGCKNFGKTEMKILLLYCEGYDTDTLI